MEITKSPRRFGQHFIDVLETCDCVIWGDGALVGLGDVAGDGQPQPCLLYTSRCV